MRPDRQPSPGDALDQAPPGLTSVSTASNHVVQLSAPSTRQVPGASHEVRNQAGSGCTAVSCLGVHDTRGDGLGPRVAVIPQPASALSISSHESRNVEMAERPVLLDVKARIKNPPGFRAMHASILPQPVGHRCLCRAEEVAESASRRYTSTLQHLNIGSKFCR
ncbi:uncharacterized protein BDZ99DRAFT_478597 [Mytilinidion resinicola]|uniref:Uncharacterized protein n=1 Tax=Mytilinidion resinicola TaxID=574789 RepID=A0A6A6YH24_9PEZI|nr:uncharacterized protein BDZ99DRAFT_478597 [Mytilinidion resinicola]KAF2808101.1 hypothetical protein BDZ99DRAFT_478597 [Mytilinidion resinicola]